jgi:sulfatase maturation enzyme AslB (radical SAM superfamily)
MGIGFRRRPEILLSNFAYCRECDYLNYCRGGCPALSYTITGEVYGPSPDACLKKFLAEGGKLPAVWEVVSRKIFIANI